MSQDIQDTSPGQQDIDTRSESLINELIKRREFGVFVAFLVLLFSIAVTRPDIFFEYGTMTNVISRLFRQVSVWVMIGIGMTFLLISGEFDLSVGSIFALGGVFFGMFVTEYQLPVVMSFLTVLAIGALIGATNGVIVTKVGIPSLIVTIGMMSAIRGIALFYSPDGTRKLSGSNALLDFLGGQHDVSGVLITNQAIIAVVLLVIFGVVLQRTRFGYHVQATGDNTDAAKKTGIQTDRVKILCFVLTGLLAAFAGVTSIAYFGTIYGTSGSDIVLLVIAAVILGGTSLFGGEGTLTGTLVGSLAIGIIPVLLIFNGIEVSVGEFLTGVIIVGVLIIDRLVSG